jgi:hypothetical protein
LARVTAFGRDKGDSHRLGPLEWRQVGGVMLPGRQFWSSRTLYTERKMARFTSTIVGKDITSILHKSKQPLRHRKSST